MDVLFGSKCSVDVLLVDIPSRHWKMPYGYGVGDDLDQEMKS